jgi:hypothetical protein
MLATPDLECKSPPRSSQAKCEVMGSELRPTPVLRYIPVMTNGFLARGKVMEANDSLIVFQPSNTNYQMHLRPTRPYSGPVGQPIDARIQAKAMKIYTVPSGGGFIAPLFGPPKTIQGRALLLDEKSVVIEAGVPIVVEIPQADSGVDLSEGPLAVGSIVNAVALPGATFEFIPSSIK